MAALTTERDTKKMGSATVPDLLELPVKASTKCIQGGIAVLDAGVLAPGRTALSLIACGVFEKTADNSSGATGAINAKVRQGVFKFANNGGSITQAAVGSDCFIVDDQTVDATNGGSTRSRAGKVVQLDSDGVWVQMALGV